jgi:hypothetical protein
MAVAEVSTAVRVPRWIRRVSRGGFHDDRFRDGRFRDGFIGFGFYPYYGYFDYGDYGQPYSQTWYYCSNLAGYYPYVAQCNTGWQAVPAS